MNIPHDKYKAELSKFYRIGYATCFENLMSKMNEFKNDLTVIEDITVINKCIETIRHYYMSYPNVPKVEDIEC